MSGEDHDGGAAQDDVLALLRHPHADAVVELGERPCAEGLDGRLREGSVEKFRGAGEHDLRDVEHADDGGECDAEPLPGVAQDADALSSSDAAASRAVSAGTASQASRQPTLPQTQSGSAVGADGDVPDLAGGEVRRRAWAGPRRAGPSRHRGRP